ncbi:SoxR reducing system RseC family protein [Pseudoteredinibacter isoporae]|uniref:Sigma-E factor negative regulatory protein RseC n=1 Tax=Pseudoteredinibacter isoporae TaxID=570281 RepID=A0A7X0JXU4_9GAMM|nr:SoxR reducing system RseC family protein [Pseudoteredinibacter isoporae]MBB6523709.1 sigma-E factor negative regulatory protein RseC [Pseudoteredinibacter isoporae]NHO89212.1 SoxR reducing system RseC family protein [Pseudoteredinibacter isoporae]NIB22177.1 SoxR reducing system RseC family protein [Pseudoteredinibacter isoporae]
MIQEDGRIIAVADDHLWLQTTQKTTCDSCQGRHACGQRLLQNLNESHGLLKVPLMDAAATAFKQGETVTIGIEESTLLRATMMAYLMPLILLLVLAFAGQQLGGELLSILGALSGLAVGGLWVRHRLSKEDCHSRFQPRLLK